MPKDKPVSFDLPEIKNAKDAAKAAGAIVSAVAAGNVTPQEAATIMSLIEGYRRALETSELERRITELENSDD